MVSFLLRHPWFLLVMLLSPGHGHHKVTGVAVAAVGLPSPASSPYSRSAEAIGGAASTTPSVVYFNQTQTFITCSEREHTPGFITTVLLFSAPFVFGCLSSENPRDYYFSVVLSGVNFPNTPIWLANRYHPVTGNASFIITPQGSLALRDSNGTEVWSSSTDGRNPAGLRLTPQGNLILFDERNNSLWQSFSEPVDLLVPGQFLNPGSMLVAGVVAGVSSSVSMTGSFSALMSQGGLIFYENSTSQPLPYFALGYPFAPETPEAVLSSPCNQTRLEVSELNMTQVQVPPSPSCVLSSSSSQRAIFFGSPIVFVRLESNGILKGYYPDHKPAFDVFRNITNEMCRIPNACGPYGICDDSQCRCPDDNSAGDVVLFNISNSKNFLLTSTSCAPKVPITCQHSSDMELHYLFEIERVDYFANNFTPPTLHTESFNVCQSACLQNCSCRAAFYRMKSKECYLHESVLSMIGVADDGYVGAIKMQNMNQSSPKSELGLIVGISIATAISIGLLVAWLYYCKHRKGKKGALDKDDVELLASLPGQPRRFSYKELQDATWEFSQKLGVGGFGSVYKGVFSDGSVVAVKQLENTSRFTQGMKEFRNEVMTLSNINHQNLVHLRGFCADSGRRLLVYEYVSNGSLDSWLFRKGGVQPGHSLDWKTRLSIAVQTARGLVFLHEQCRNRIVHLDIKPQNILLDENFVPKLSDFGLSRLINEDQDSAVTRMRGTPGYMAPECLVLTDATEKSDVYSFGMVLLEIVSGRKNVDVSRLTVHGDGEGWYFPALASRKFKEGNVLDIIDKALIPLGSEDMAEATRVLKIAFWCIQDNPSLRPTMGKTLLMLEGYSKVVQPPLSFSFGMRFHLSNSIPSNPRTPNHGTPPNDVLDKPNHNTPEKDVLDKLKHATETRNHHDEAQSEVKDSGGEQGEAMDLSSCGQSQHPSPFSSDHTSPRASPIPSLLSHNSFSHSPFREASPRHSFSPSALPHVAAPRRASPLHLSPVSSPRKATSPLPVSPLSQSSHPSPLHSSASPPSQTETHDA